MPVPDVQKIGKYEILAELGQGGYGRVYRAFDPTVGRPVAIKILTAETNRDLLTRFRNEATAAGNLRHRNIVTVYDYGEYNDRPYLVMELLEGEDLTHIIANRTPLSLLQKMNIMDQIAAGLECAHQNGVLHRDVKPANIRILPDGTVKIMDFGIARVSSDRNATRLTQQGDLIGTILYMSPEQFGGSEADALCDIFAYGLIYFELLTGKHPFRSSDPRTVMFKITTADPEPLRSFDPSYPEGLERILNRALQKDRELRYQNLRDLQLDAEPLIFELKQARARELVAGALELAGEKDSQKALPLINEALNLDPSNRDARRLREDVQRHIQKAALQPRIEALLQSAQEQLAQRSFTPAIQSLESARKLDETDDRVREVLESAREQVKRSKEASGLAAAALAHLTRKEWPAASTSLLEAARIDPLNPDIGRVRDEIGKHIRLVLSRIDRQIKDDDLLEPAIRELHALEALQPASPEIQSRLAAAGVRQEIRRRIQTVIEAAQRHIERAQFDEALAEIGQELQSSPNERRLTELRVRAQAGKEARERELLVQRSVLDAARRRDESRFEDALAIVAAGLARYPDAQALLDLRKQLQEELERQRYSAAVLKELEAGRELLKQGDPAQAEAALRKAADRYPEDEGLRQLLKQAREALALQQRRQAVESAAAEARRCVEDRDFGGAIRVLETALKLWPQEKTLNDLLRATRDRHDKWQREHELKTLEQQCDLLSQANQFEEALEKIQAGLARFPGEPALVELRDRVQEVLERQQRARLVRNALEEAGQLLKQGRAADAIAVLTQASRRYPDEPDVQNLLHEAQAALRSRQRDEAIGKALAEAGQKSGRQDFSGAIRVLEAALGQWPEGYGPGEKLLTEALGKAREAQRDQERQLAVSKAVRAAYDDSTTLLRQGRAEDAVRALTLACRQYPGEERLKQLLLEAQQTLESQRRRTAIEKAAADARQQSERADIAGAIATLEGALKSWPGEESLVDLLRKTRDAQARAERRRAIHEVVQAAERLTGQNRRAEALQVVQAGLRTYSGEPELLETERRLREQLELERRSAAVDEILKAGRQLLEKGQPGQAVDVLTQGCREYAGEARLTQLLAQAQEALRLQQKNEAVEKIAAEAQQCVERRDFDAAIEILTNGLKSWPKESRLSDLLRETRKAREDRDREEAIRAVVLQAEKLAGENRLGDALKAVQAGLRKHGPDLSLTALQQQIQAQLASRQLAEAAQRRTAVQDRTGAPPAAVSRTYLLAGGIAGLLVAAVAAWLFRPAGSVALTIESNVPGAAISVGGQSCVLPNCALKLQAGNYTLVAVKDGFSPLERPLSLKASRGDFKVPLVFAPLPQLIQVNTNFASGKVLLDGTPAGDLRDGQFSLDRVSSGSHTIRVTGGDAEFEARWREEPGTAPELTQPISAKNVDATLLANAGGNGTLACNCDPRNIQVDGNAVDSSAAPGGLSTAVTNLKKGSRRITVADRSLLVDVRPNPTLNIFLSLDRNVGTLVIETGQDNATVYLNNRQYRRLTEHGLLRIPVDVGQYEVRAEKPGFRSPAAAKVQVGKGEEKQVALALTELPASLEISGALPGAQVKVDGKPVGETSAGGTLKTDVASGDHEIEVTKQDYNPVRFGARFTPGQATRPKPEQIRMARVFQPPPVRPDPKQLEAQDWEKVRNSNSTEELDDFIRKHPGGTYTDGARARIVQLRQQVQAEAARQAEQTAWDSLDKSRKAAVQDFLSRYGNGPHQQDARAVLTELEKREADALARASAEQQKAAEQKAKDQEQARRTSADQQSIITTLNQYEAAYNAKDLKALQTIWRGMPKSVSDPLAAQFRYARSMAFQMRPAAAPVIDGDSATVVCTRTLDLTTPDNQKVNSGNERVRVTLDRAAPGWVIRSVVTF